MNTVRLRIGDDLMDGVFGCKPDIVTFPIGQDGPVETDGCNNGMEIVAWSFKVSDIVLGFLTRCDSRSCILKTQGTYEKLGVARIRFI